jgi:nucleotide-binding universal stress UspA family protein
MTKNNKDQKIIVWCNTSHQLKNAILDAIYLASVFKKDLCLFANYKNQKEKNKLEERIQGYASFIHEKMPSLKFSTLLTEGKLKNLIFSLGSDYNCIVLCCGSRVSNKLLQAFYKAQFPFFFSSETVSDFTNGKFKDLCIPVDFRESTKDALIWSSYFARFNGSFIQLLTANEQTDPQQNNKVESNINAALKLFEKINYTPKIVHSKKSSWNIHNEAFKQKTDLVVFSGSYYVTFFDRLIGSFEKRLINKHNVPVLLTNPRIENYILCD